jgi:hypothetical protein
MAGIAIVGTATAFLVVGLALDRQRVIASQAAVDEIAQGAAMFAATGEPIPNDRDVTNFTYGTLRMSHGKLHAARVERVSVSRKGPRIDVVVVADVDSVALQWIGREKEKVVGRGTASR